MAGDSPTARTNKTKKKQGGWEVKDELGLLRLEPKWRPGTFAQEPRKNMVKTTARVRPTLKRSMQ